MKAICIYTGQITLPVAPGYPKSLPENGNMSLLFLTECTYMGCPDMEVGEIYEVIDQKINWYGVHMLYFDGFYGWRPRACFADWDGLEEIEEEHTSVPDFYINNL